MAYNWGFRVLKTRVPKSSEHQLGLYGFRNSTLSPTPRRAPRWLLCPWTKWRAIVDHQGHGGWWGGVPPPGSWRRVEHWGAELQSARHPHPTSAIAVCLMCFFMGIPQESDRQDGSYKAHTHVRTQVCKAQFQDPLD